MKQHYDAIVVGSGFGGAVAACRLAQAGLDVLVLERGRRFAPSELGASVHPESFLWDAFGGIYDVRSLGGMMIIQSAAWGGGSQVYANVHLRPPAEVFARGWPPGVDRARLDPYYDLVAHMLDLAPITAAPSLPAKTRRLRTVADQLGRSSDFFYPNLAVRFGGPAHNKFGVPQGACQMCGECALGCRHGAKNTLDLNYLAVAEQRGASVATDAEVVRIAPSSGGYRVAYRGRGDDHVRTVDARAVFLCAGAVNTTELLLRARDQHGTLPGLSSRLGTGYSGNGDYIGFAFHADDEIDPADGPTITTALRYDRSASDGTWFLLEDGGFPHLRTVLAAAHRQGAALLDSDLLARAEALLGLQGNRGAAALLCMGRDRGDGRIELVPANKQLAIRWNTDGHMPLYEAQERLSTDIAHALGGAFMRNPVWQLLNKPMSVHSLGGCPVGPDRNRGVVDDAGEVHGYPGLFVLDGAAIPSSVGVNPASTIAAVAERNIERYLRRRFPAWQAPERAAAVAIVDPLSALPSGGASPRPETPFVGVRFRETMTGHIAPGLVPSLPFDRAQYEAAARTGERAGNTLAVELTITMPNLRNAHDAALHAGNVRGTLRAAALFGPAPLEIRDGVFQLFVEPSRDAAGGTQVERRMIYLLPFVGPDGRPYLLDGMKVVRDEPARFDLWSTTTTLYTVLREGHDRAGRVIGAGIVQLHLRDLVRQLATLRVIGTGGLRARLDGAATFARLFFGGLWDVFVAPRLGLGAAAR